MDSLGRKRSGDTPKREVDRIAERSYRLRKRGRLGTTSQRILAECGNTFLTCPHEGADHSCSLKTGNRLAIGIAESTDEGGKCVMGLRYTSCTEWISKTLETQLTMRQRIREASA